MIDREFFLGFIKIHILYHASKEPISGVELSKELGRHGYILGPGTLYPTLHRLEKDGYLTQETRVVSGRMRKYYTATEEGMKVLDETRNKIKELIGEVLFKNPIKTRQTRLKTGGSR